MITIDFLNSRSKALTLLNNCVAEEIGYCGKDTLPKNMKSEGGILKCFEDSNGNWVHNPTPNTQVFLEY